jgi:hypothetical protein
LKGTPFWIGLQELRQQQQELTNGIESN